MAWRAEVHQWAMGRPPGELADIDANEAYEGMYPHPIAAGDNKRWRRLSVDTPEGELLILGKGDLLPDYVDDFAKVALISCGAVTIIELPESPPAAA